MRWLLLLLGFCEVEPAPGVAGDFLELCRAAGRSPRRIKRTGEGRIRCVFFALEVRHVLEAAREQGILLRVTRRGGTPHFCGRVLRRPGLVAGLLLALALTVASRLFLFGVEITGNETVAAKELREELAAAGLRTGSFLPGLDTDAVAAALRRGDARIAYAAVNLQGTVARVQIREAREGESAGPRLPANLVAKSDGVITSPLVYEGRCLVQEGDVVRAGQLLASGLLDTENNGLRVTRAAGEILARTVHTYTVYVPFVYEEKCHTGREWSEISLLFFSLDRKVFKTTGKRVGRCDIIEKTEWLSVGGRELPIGFARTQYAEYVLTEARYTAEEALAKAYEELGACLFEESAARRVLSRRTETVVDGDGVTLICTVVAEENIAATVEFSIG